MSLASIIEATRRAAALFDMPDRGVLEVLGDDRVRWLDGMISGDVARLAEGPSGGGCYATLLTNRGAIVADLHVGRLEDRFVLETAREWIPKTKETLERFIIADDVELRDLSSDLSVLGLEGPLAAEMLARACGAEISLAPDAWGECTIADRAVRIAAFGFTGERGFQLHASRDDAEAVRAALEVAGEAEGLVRGDAEALEVLRVEAGIPMLGRELDEDVLPAEARLDRAIATDKGCYVGQEIVARVRARGQVNHLLVGLRVDGDALPKPDEVLSAGGKRTGEVTSVARSPELGAIALGYVRREHAELGTRVEFDGGSARVERLPFPMAAP